MFDEVTKREGGKRAARRGVWVAVSSAAQTALVVAIIVVSSKIAADVAQGPVVDVKFVKTAAPPPPPPPPPPPARKTPPKPKTDNAPKPKPPNPMAMVQPRDVPNELKPPDPNEPPEPEYDYGSDQGVEGGVVGGVVGAGDATAQAGGGIEEAPAYATAGFRKPEQAQRGCVQTTVRVPRELTGFISGPVTVKFAIGRDGVPSLFQVVGQAPDPRITNAIWQAVQQCKWVPGADAQGRPTKIWVVLPVRFTSG